MTIEVQKLRSLLSAATERPWRVDAEPDVDASPEEYGFRVQAIVGQPEAGESEWHARIVETDSGVYPPRKPDADLIVAAVNALPELLELAEAVGAFHDAARDGTSTDAYTARERLFDLVRKFGLSPTDRVMEALTRSRGREQG